MLIPELLYAAEQSPAIQLFNQYCNFYEQRNIPAIKELFTSDCYNFGTGKDEVLKGWDNMEAQLKRDFSQSKSARIEIISIDKNTTYFAAGLWNAHITFLDDSQKIWEGLRFTIQVIQNTNGDWKIDHTHASAPAIDQVEGESFPPA